MRTRWMYNLYVFLGCAGFLGLVFWSVTPRRFAIISNPSHTMYRIQYKAGIWPSYTYPTVYSTEKEAKDVLDATDTSHWEKVK